MNRLCVLILSFGLATFSSSVSAAAIDSGAAQTLLQRHGNAVVAVKLVVVTHMTLGGRVMPPRERRVDVNGVLVTSSGLVVTALSEVDPRSALMTVQKRGDASAPGGVVDSTLTQIRLEFADGRDVAAELIERDEEFDLAFFVPMAGEWRIGAIDHVDMRDAADPELLGSYVLVSRAAKALRRAAMIRPTVLTGFVESPRRSFLMTTQQPGVAIFDAKGRVLGLTVECIVDELQGGFVVVPAQTLAERIDRVVKKHGLDRRIANR